MIWYVLICFWYGLTCFSFDYCVSFVQCSSVGLFACWSYYIRNLGGSFWSIFVWWWHDGRGWSNPFWFTRFPMFEMMKCLIVMKNHVCFPVISHVDPCFSLWWSLNWGVFWNGGGTLKRWVSLAGYSQVWWSVGIPQVSETSVSALWNPNLRIIMYKKPCNYMKPQ